MMTPDTWAPTVAALVVVVGALVGWFKWALPRYRRFTYKATAAVDSLVGREEIRDSITGQLLLPALPGIGVRMASTEGHVAKLAEAVSALAQTHHRLDDHDERLRRLENRYTDEGDATE